MPGALALLPPAFQAGFLQSHPIDNNVLAVNPPGYNSRHKFNVQARLHTEVGNGVELALLLNVTYQSKFFFNDASKRIPAIQEILFNGGAPLNQAAKCADFAPGVTLVNLRAEANGLFGKELDFAIEVNNLAARITSSVAGGSMPSEPKRSCTVRHGCSTRKRSSNFSMSL